jgi:hypothetical protein
LPADLVVIVGDTHCNSTVGLCPPAINLDDGGTYRASKAQLWLWRNWLDFWAKVASLKVEYEAHCTAIFNGDWGEKAARGGYQVITRNETDILRIGRAGAEPAMETVDDLFLTRGTAVHVGDSAYLEEALGEDLGAVRADDGKFAWWRLRAEFGAVLFDVRHHPDTWGTRPWTMRAAAARQSSILLSQYAERGEKAADVAVFNHVHYLADSGHGTKPRTFFNWGWQLRPAYVGGKDVRPVGGLIFVCDSGEFQEIVKTWSPPKRRHWKRQT